MREIYPKKVLYIYIYIYIYIYLKLISLYLFIHAEPYVCTPLRNTSDDRVDLNNSSHGVNSVIQAIIMIMAIATSTKELHILYIF